VSHQASIKTILAPSEESSVPQTLPSDARSIATTAPSTGAIIVNADDWGRDANTTDRIFDCIKAKAVSSVSGMVLMEDSERAADLACARKVDVGLHLNFTSCFSAAAATSTIKKHQGRVSKFLLSNRLSQIVFHPGLANSFKYLVNAQIEEFYRIYGAEPDRIDGHHHMHLCANVLFGELMPGGTLVRRNFSFATGEKSWLNRYYRNLVDRRLNRRHRVVDYLFSLQPLEPPDRLQRVFALARHAFVELETHPVNLDEYQFLTSGELLAKVGDFPVPFGHLNQRKVDKSL
jgi:hypothetical protein